MAEQNLDIVIRVRGGQISSQEIKQVGTSVGNVGTQAEETSKKTGKLRSAMSGLAAGFAVYKGYQYIKGAVNETVSLAKATTGLQRITGMDSQTASGWVSIAKERGVQAKQLNMGFITLARNISGAAAGSKTSAKAFASLGLDAANLKVQDSRTQLSMIADSFKALPAGVDKATLAQKLFGRQSQALLPLLYLGAGALNKQVDEMGRTVGMSGKTQKAALELAKQQRELNAQMTGLKVAVATALLPILEQLAKVLVPVIQAFATMLKQSPLFRLAVIALTGALVAYVAAVNLAKIAQAEWIATAAPWLALAVAIGVGLVELYRHSAAFRNILNAVKDAGVAAFGWIKNAAAALVGWVSKNWPTLLTILTGPIGVAARVIIGHWHDITGAAKALWNFLKSVGSYIGGAFAGAWNGAATAIQAVAKAIGAVVSTAQKIASLPGKALKFLGNAATGGINAIGSALAEGGTVGPGGTVALVGEKGPEVLALPGGSTVYPNSSLGSLGGGKMTVHTHVHLDRRQIALAMGDYVADQQAAR